MSDQSKSRTEHDPEIDPEFAGIVLAILFASTVIAGLWTGGIIAAEGAFQMMILTVIVGSLGVFFKQKHDLESRHDD